MFRSKKSRILGVATAATAVGAVALAATMVLGSGTAAVHANGGKAATGVNQGDGIGTPKYLTEAPSNFSATATTIPYWQSSFTDPTNGVTYPFTMVGTNPLTNQTTTTFQTEIIPLSFTFVSSAAADNTLDGSTKVDLTIQSPMFQSTANIGKAADSTASAAPDGVAPSPRTESEPSDTTQVADAVMRSEFGVTGSKWHVLLGQPTVEPTVSISVPQNQGELLVGSVSHARIGLMSYSWFSSQLKNILVSQHTDPHVVPIFLVYNTFLYEGSLGNCCVLGYHGATSSLNGNGKQQVNTYMFASYSDPGIFGANPGDSISYIQDIHALSHEVQEWTNDPFVNNIVNPWLTPTAPQYGCTNDLETGDPVVGYGFSVKMSSGVTYHPEDEVFYSWFARQSPSISSAGTGVYTYLNNFAGVAHGC